jgi:hypothetical protein
MLDTLRQQSKQQDNANAALLLINDATLSFSEKVTQVEALEEKASSTEKPLFAEIYSSLHVLAQTQDDRDLMAGF